MKKFKNVLVVASLLLFVLALTGCSEKYINIEGSLESIMEKLYAEIPEEDQPMMLENIKLLAEEDKVNPENLEGYIEYFVGTADFEYEEAIASESMTGSTAHSVVLIRTKDNESVRDILDKIEKNVNPRKWICVGVEKEDVIIKSKGNLIMVVIVEDEVNRDKIDAAFDKLK